MESEHVPVNAALMNAARAGSIENVKKYATSTMILSK
jgi:hypothetical protein